MVMLGDIMEKTYSVTVAEGDIDTSMTSSGAVIDVLALATQNQEYNDLTDSYIDEEHYTIEYALDNYNFEDALLKMLNNDAGKMTWNNVLSSGIWFSYNKYADAQEEKKQPVLLAGAWMALEHPDAFNKLLKEWTAKVKEACATYYDDADNVIPADLLAEIETSIEENAEQHWKEWAWGDHRDWRGILPEARSMYEADKIDLDDGKVTFTWDVDQAGSFMSGYGTEEENDKPIDEAVMKRLLIDDLVYRANSFANRQRAEAQKRAEEYRKTKAYKEERQKKEDEARKQKLLAMTK